MTKARKQQKTKKAYSTKCLNAIDRIVKREKNKTKIFKSGKEFAKFIKIITK